MVTRLKAMAWRILAGAYYYSGLPFLRHPGRVAILTYHRVVLDEMAQAEHIQPGMYVRARSFEAHLAYIRKRFVVLALEELLEIWRAGRLDRRKSYCVITFDDGWRDNYEYAFPLLKKYGLSATIFLATDYIGTSRWFWPDQIAFLVGQASERITKAELHRVLRTILEQITDTAETKCETLLRQLQLQGFTDPDALIEWCKGVSPELVPRFVDYLGEALAVNLPNNRVLLNWDEVREMASQGITFGSHSCSHRIMTRISPAEAKNELTESWQTMLQQGIKPIPVFCFPNGDCNLMLKALARENEYVAAFASEMGLEGSKPNDLFSLKRMSFHEDTTSSIPLLTLKLSGLR